MRIKIIGENNCARATRQLLRQARFAVTEFLPAEVIAQAPHSGYAITINLSSDRPSGLLPAPHNPASNSFGVNPDPTSTPDDATHGQPATADVEADSFLQDATVSSGNEAASSFPLIKDSSASAQAYIQFDSVDSVLEQAILRHVTQLIAIPVVVDRQGGTVRSERELRIVLPCTGNVKIDEAAAVAVELGVLRGLLDLTAPPERNALDGGACDGTSAKPKKWWMFGIVLLAGSLLTSVGTIDASPNERAKERHVIEKRGTEGSFLHLEAAMESPQGQYGTSLVDVSLIGGVAVSSSLYDATNTALKVNCVVGCSGGSGGGGGNVNVTQWNTTPLGAPTVWGTAPTSGNVINVNANVLNSSIPVSGTFWQATQPVSWSGQSVSLTGSWPYSGMLGNVGGLGTAGSPSGGVISIQGVSSGTAVPVSGTFWQTTQPVSCTASNCASNLAQLDGSALGAPSNYGTSPGAVAVQGVNAYITNTVPVSGTFWQTTQPVSWSGQSVSLNGSWPYSGALGTVSLTGNLPGFSSTPTVYIGNTPNTTPILVTQTPATSGGNSTAVSQAITSSAQVKSSAGQKCGHSIFNPNSGTVYVFWYNTTTAPTIGSTTNLIEEIGIPAGGAANVESTNCDAYSSGIYIAVSTAASSSTAPSTGLVITTKYK